jgi:hypothetical protein
MAVVTGYYYGVARMGGRFLESAFTGAALLAGIAAPVFAAASWLAERRRQRSRNTTGDDPADSPQRARSTAPEHGAQARRTPGDDCHAADTRGSPRPSGQNRSQKSTCNEARRDRPLTPSRRSSAGLQRGHRRQAAFGWPETGQADPAHRARERRSSLKGFQDPGPVACWQFRRRTRMAADEAGRVRPSRRPSRRTRRAGARRDCGPGRPR